MKRENRYFCAATAVAVALTANAAALKNVDVQPYNSAQSELAYFSVTDVVDAGMLHGEHASSKALVVQAPCTITLLQDGLTLSAIPGKLTGAAWEFGEYVRLAGNDFDSYVEFTSLAITDVAGCTAASSKAEYPAHKKGCSVTLSEPALYGVTARNASGENGSQLVASADIDVGGGHMVVRECYYMPDEAGAPAMANPTAAKVLVDGKQVAFQAYEIAGSNYFKLRDLAMALNGTAKQFNVFWFEEMKSISLTASTPYVAVGGELAPGDGVRKTAKRSSAIITKDSASIAPMAYEIAGNNYYKLRDVAQAFNIGIAWDGATQTITIDTRSSYVQ